MKPLQIAIDGPVAAGKGDIAARLSKKLGLLYIYTGGFYRSLSYACRLSGVSTKDKDKVLEILRHTHIDQVKAGPFEELPYKFLVNGNDVTKEIFKENMGASDVAVIPEVRQFMVKRQQEIAKGNGVVMEGRDITFRVLPEAQFKIFLNASVEERAKRRWMQHKSQGMSQSFEKILAETKKRDQQDMTRETDPLRKIPEAWELDTTGMTQEAVVNTIISELKRRKLI